jgi:hypothetical protein
MVAEMRADLVRVKEALVVSSLEAIGLTLGRSASVAVTAAPDATGVR